MTVSIEVRFWAKVDRSGDCWPWTARAHNSHGYGVFQLGRGKGLIGAHRLAWMLTNGPIPDGLFVLHRCDNPPCCNPAHLFLGTNADNVRDMMAKGRSAQQQRTACPAGHPYDDANTFVTEGRRRCRECRKTKRRARRDRTGAWQ